MVSSIGSNSYLSSLQNQSKAYSTISSNSTTDTSNSDNDLIYFNPDSMGGNQLTPEETQALSENYDVNNMTDAKQIQLLGQLTVYGVVSAKDFGKALGEYTDSIVMPNMPAPGPNITSTVCNYKSYDQGKKYNWIDEYTNDAKTQIVDGKYTNQGQLDLELANVFQQLA